MNLSTFSRATRTGPIVPGLLPRRDAWCSGGLPLAGNYGRLQSARDLGIPFVLVIASTNGEVAIDGHDIPGALFGSPEFQWSPGVDLGEPGRLVFGSGGRLQAHLNTRFSAVALIARGTADTPAGNGQACRLQVFHNPFASIALKPEFAGPYDDQWAAVDSGRKYQLTGPD